MTINVDDTVVGMKPNQSLTDGGGGRGANSPGGAASPGGFVSGHSYTTTRAKDTLLCHMCLVTYKSKKMKPTSRADPPF